MTPTWEFIGGNPSLDFVNTIEARRDNPQGGGDPSRVINDRLTSYAALVDWAVAGGIMMPSTARKLNRVSALKRKEAALVLTRAIGLREALYRVFRDVMLKRTPRGEMMELLDKERVAAQGQQKLVRSEGRFSLAFESRQSELDCMLWPVALSGVELLLSEHRARIRQCPGPDCGWLFLDSTRNGSRRWCEMKTCGTRDKVRRYRQRQT